MPAVLGGAALRRSGRSGSRSSTAPSRRMPSSGTRSTRSSRTQLGRSSRSQAPRPERQPVALAVPVGLAGEHKAEHGGAVAGDHEDGPVLALARVLLVGHPGPHDLARVGLAVELRRVDQRAPAHRLGRRDLSPLGRGSLGCRLGRGGLGPGGLRRRLGRRRLGSDRRLRRGRRPVRRPSERAIVRRNLFTKRTLPVVLVGCPCVGDACGADRPAQPRQASKVPLPA